MDDEKKYPAIMLKTYWQRHPAGHLEHIDIETGAVIAVAYDPGQEPVAASFVEQVIDGHKVMVQTGMDYAHLTFKARYKYSEALADVIAQYILDGTPWTDIPAIKNMPTMGVMRAWMREHKYFNDRITDARRGRAELLRDKAVKIGVESVGVDKDEVPGRKLATDVLRWGAEKDDPATYGSKVQVDGGVTVVVKLETGIRRSLDSNSAAANSQVVDASFRNLPEAQPPLLDSNTEIIIPEGNDEPESID